MNQYALTLALLCSVLAPTLWSQALPPLAISEGTLLAERRGYAVADAGDLNGDGIADHWVGSPFDSTTGLQSGAVRAISGKDGVVLYTLVGAAAVDHFGWSIAALGDVNGDGVCDIAVGSPDSDLQALNAGAVRVASGANGATLFSIFGSTSGAAFGFSVCSAGDVNGDGVADFSVGAPFDSSAGSSAGAVETYSGLNGALLAYHFGANAGDRLGIAVASAGDVDLDGRADVLAGADQEGVGAGYVRLYSGRTGGVMLTLSGTLAGERFGCALAGGSDFDGDGVLDIAVGASGALHNNAALGCARVFSALGGALIFTAFGAGPGEAFGSTLAFTADLDGDGRADLVVAGAFEAGASGASGVVRAISSRTQRILHVWHGRSGGDRFGFSLCAASDRDGDGIADLLVGAPKDDVPLTDCGAVFVLSTRSSEATHYCNAKVNSQGCLPQSEASGYASPAGGAALELAVSMVLNNKPGLFLFGKLRAATPFMGGTLCVAAPIQRSSGVNSGGSPGASNCSGVLRFTIDANWIQHFGWQPGQRIDVQAWYRDPQHPDGTSSGLGAALEFSVWL